MAIFDFTVQATDTSTAARAATFETAHGVVPTPMFMPVGTRATVKGVTPDQLRWDPLPMPAEGARVDFVDGLFTMAGNGGSAAR